MLRSSLRIAALTALLGTAAIASAQTPDVPFPKGWRDWHHVKSMTINPGHPLYESFGGIHHLYANPKAVQGYKSGRFPDGAVIAFDLLEAKSADNAVVEGERKVLGVMVRDAKRYAATGGWGYEGFKGGDPAQRVVRGNAATACHACHAQQKDKGYVFSQLRP